ncbi:tRNA threonylcarbamoyladenosine dehydratase [Basilea psittacipulmonis]|uniref:Heme biosynthesis protein HemY n=1 Tax=Basilea psittacipulmonis DSM 24701 TaxID=1072685 RepID=A0A077DEB2_9BURK|nr:tRNA threonylcarbamoyladenosine dehydratase [Basilea psittacipulmonis]AIL33180.1 heme biosynthesis protein HemY [Basilea psittacipulmonis DSM 24701]
MSEHKEINIQRRFASLKRLYGELFNPQSFHVMIVGIGGVGSWAAEALARTGVGKLTLCDLDHIAESNINRQIHALTSTLGQAKTRSMAERIREINPDCVVNEFDDFINQENIATVLDQYQPDFVIDACDQHDAKVAIIEHCRQRQISFIVCGSAGGKQNPLSLRFGDLSESKYDALLQRIRQTLRKSYHYPKGADAKGKALKKVPKMNVQCLWFEETTVKPTQSDCQLQGLSCAGYGSCVTITATMGLMASNVAIQSLKPSCRE